MSVFDFMLTWIVAVWLFLEGAPTKGHAATVWFTLFAVAAVIDVLRLMSRKPTR